MTKEQKPTYTLTIEQTVSESGKTKEIKIVTNTTDDVHLEVDAFLKKADIMDSDFIQISILKQ